MSDLIEFSIGDSCWSEYLCDKIQITMFVELWVVTQGPSDFF